METSLAEQTQDQEQVQEQVPDLESMSTEQVAEYLDKQGAQPKPEGEAPAQQEKEETPLSPVEQKLANIERELGRFRGMQSTLDKFPTLLQSQVEAILQKRFQPQSTPEELQQKQLQQTEEQALQRYIQENAVAALKQQFGPQVEFLEKAREDYQDGRFLSEVSQAAENFAPGSSQLLAQLYEQNAKDLQSGDQAVMQKAMEWHDKATKSQEFVVLELAKAHQASVKNQAGQFQQNRQVAGQKAGQVIRADRSGRPATQKSTQGMTTEQLESMSTEELGKLIPWQK